VVTVINEFVPYSFNMAMITRLGIFIVSVQIFVVCVMVFMLYSTQSGKHQEFVNVLVVQQHNVRGDVKLPASSPKLSPSLAQSNPRRISVVNSSAAPTVSGTVWKRITKTVHTTRPTVSSTESKHVRRQFTTFLLIMVPSLPVYATSRDLIRNTWYKGFSDSNEVMLRFAMGTKEVTSNVTMATQLTKENGTHGDLIYFEHFRENRSALTNKTLLLITWAYENVNFTYFMKCDDDTFVFVNRTIAELKRRPTTTALYYGKIQKGKPRKKGGPWLDLSWNIGDSYLPYALGGAYIISSDLIGLIAEGSEYLQWHPNEDTAVGSWLAPYKYERRTDALICMFLETESKSKKCPINHIIHLFYGITRTELKQHFLNLTELLT